MLRKPLYILLTIAAAIVSALLWEGVGYFRAGPLEQPVTLVFPPNTHFTAIADNLEANGIIHHSLLFKAVLFLSGKSSKIEAGEYAFPPHISAEEVAGMLASGKTLMHHLTVPEGLMTSEILEIIRTNSLLSGEITYDVKEGEILPETYNYSRGDKRNDIIERMRHAMQKALAEAWAGRADHLPFATPVQALTLASIVEKETGIAAERPRVAAVYINRLNRGMLLQADPTTAYAVTGGRAKLTRPLTYHDLEFNSSYNTYKFPGLPPGPIANPGKASILATLHPVTSNELYFVATGNGGHNFAATVEEHEKNVKKYRENHK